MALFVGIGYRAALRSEEAAMDVAEFQEWGSRD
jgi:hypothetical protein